MRHALNVFAGILVAHGISVHLYGWIFTGVETLVYTMYAVALIVFGVGLSSIARVAAAKQSTPTVGDEIKERLIK